LTQLAIFLARAGPGARAAAVALALALTGLAGMARADGLETAIKATYLYKFAPFVEWPDSAFAGPTSPFALCIVGADPFGSVLDRAVQGQHVGERPIVVRRLDTAQRAVGCQVVYLAGSPGQSVAEALKALRGAPVLTVADGRAAGAMINFELRDQRVRFEIDDAAAADAGLNISSKLLSLAVEVQRRNGKAPAR
jgi:hypothetical protein